jgi:uncharacterized membrane protein YhaH (DUF805 family)
MISNRIGRLEFLFWCGAPIVLGSIVLSTGAFVIGTKDIRDVRGLFALVLIVASLVILRAEVSRFHDLGWSGWPFLLAFVPIVDIVVLLFLLLVPGQKTKNLYGEPPIFLQGLRKVRKAA